MCLTDRVCSYQFLPAGSSICKRGGRLRHVSKASIPASILRATMQAPLEVMYNEAKNLSAGLRCFGTRAEPLGQVQRGPEAQRRLESLVHDGWIERWRFVAAAVCCGNGTHCTGACGRILVTACAASLSDLEANESQPTQPSQDE